MATATSSPEEGELISSSDGETIENQQQTDKDRIVIGDITDNAQQQQRLHAPTRLQTQDFCQDIQIHSSLTGLLDDHKSKIEHLFHVKLVKRELTQTDKSEPGCSPTVQWIQLRGSKLDCKDAGEYISSLCNPAVFNEFEYDPSLHDAIGNNSIECERIEHQTRAVLFALFPGRMHIQGDELTIALAVSLLEDLVQQNSTDCKSAPSPRQSLLDNMLNEKLPTSDDDASYKSRVQKMPEEVKRSMLTTIDDSDKLDELAKNQTSTSSGGTAAKPVSSISNPMEQYLKSVAAKKGYSEAEALKILSQSSQSMSDADFIRRLSTARRTQQQQKPVSNDDSMLNSQVSAQLNDTKITSSSSNADWGMMQDDTSWMPLGGDESEDTAVICLRSDDDELELQTASSRQLRGTEGSSAAAAIVVPSDDEVTLISHSAPVSSNVKSKKTGGNVVNTGNKMDTGSKYDDLDLISLPVSVSPSSKKGKRTVTQENAVRVAKPNSSARPSAFSQQPIDIYQNRLPAPAQFLHSRDVPDAIPSHSMQTGGGVGRGFAIGNMSSSSSRHEERLQFGSGPKLRYVVIDGSNVAMSHSNGKYFSCRGIQIVVEYFRKRGHSKITAFVPQWRRQTSLSRDYPIRDQELLDTLCEEGFLVFSPSRRVGNRNITPYDDRFILDLAIQTEGVVVSNDNYRDLYDQKQEFREVIEKRLLPYSFVGDIFMIPDDPLGRNGPNLDQFLTMPSKESGPLHPSPVQTFFGARPTIHSYHSTATSNPPFAGGTNWTRPPSTQFKTPAPVQDNAWPGLPTSQQTARSGSNRGNVLQNKSVQHKHRSGGGPQPQQQQPKAGHQSVKTGGGTLRTPEMTVKVRSQLLEVFSESSIEIDKLLLRYPNDNNIEKLSALLIGEMESSH